MEIGSKYKKSSAQILIRWSVQSGFVCVVKSSKPERVKQNSEIFDFELSNEDMKKINALKSEKLSTSWSPETEVMWD